MADRYRRPLSVEDSTIPTRLLASLAAVTLMAACRSGDRPPSAPDPGGRGSGARLPVSSAADDGPGSLRAALAAASRDTSVGRIVIDAAVGTIILRTGLELTGRQALTIEGGGVTIDGSGCRCDALTSAGGGELIIERLAIRGAPGNGLAVLVPPGASGVVSVRLRDVIVEDNGLHGVYVEDQIGASAAGLEVEIMRSRIARNGNGGGSDFDGVRVNEGGEGGLVARIVESDVTANGGDGVELDEAGPGDVWAEVGDSRFDGNGAHDPADVDDGFDIDEADAGSVAVHVSASSADANAEGGWDIDETGSGGIRFTALQVSASRNGAEGVSLAEDGEGTIEADLDGVTATGNVLDGAAVAELAAGDAVVRVSGSVIAGNRGAGLDLSQGGVGRGQATVGTSDLEGNRKGRYVSAGVRVTLRH